MNSLSKKFIDVALPVPLRQTFEYFIPEDFPTQPTVGARVRVTLGSRELVGVILAIKDTPTFDENKVKQAAELLDKTPCAPGDLLQFLNWAARYYHHPLGEVISAALPQKFRVGEHLSTPKAWVLTTEGKGLPSTALKRAPKQQALFQYLLEHNKLNEDNLEQAETNSATLNALKKKGLIEKVELKQETSTNKISNSSEDAQTLDESILAEQGKQLSDEQAAALNQIRYHKFACYLLEGATGSGKTEVYLQIIARVLQANKQALVLIPEIGLTPQTLSRFRKRFKVPIAELHSNVSETLRTQNWCDARDNKAKIIIGTRLAALCPLSNLGVIIIDEEHDLSYKQQDGFKYSARDLSIYRASNLNIPIVLGSATPSLESFHNAIQRRYEHLRMTQRAGSAVAPVLSVVDLRGKAMTSGLSLEAIAEIKNTLKQNNQALIFINRRGYAPALICHHCGWTAECFKCDTRMTLHYSPKHLRCHHCDAQRAIPFSCPSCNNRDLTPEGYGTEQTESALTKMFPDTPVYRIDRDTTQSKKGMQSNLEQVNNGQSCILVGTQMLAKGHHFPNVTLVVIVNADQGFLSPDFRGPERMGQLIVQVSGRSGRGDKPGKVLIQSHQPEHPQLHLLLEKGYHLYARALLSNRQASMLAPFWHMTLIRAESKRPENAVELLAMTKSIAAKMSPPSPQLHYLGPIPAPIEKINERFRYQLLIKSSQRAQLHQLIERLVREVDQHALSKRVRWSVDIDPQDNS